jgi:hypothetical protein
VDLWQAQNQLLEAYHRLATAGNLGEGLAALFGTLAEKLTMRPALLGWHP